jgi:hypothetical protein
MLKLFLLLFYNFLSWTSEPLPIISRGVTSSSKTGNFKSKMVEQDTVSLDQIPLEEVSKDESVPDSTEMWKTHHLLLATFLKSLINTARRFGYTYTPFLSRYDEIPISFNH